MHENYEKSRRKFQKSAKFSQNIAVLHYILRTKGVNEIYAIFSFYISRYMGKDSMSILQVAACHSRSTLPLGLSIFSKKITAYLVSVIAYWVGNNIFIYSDSFYLFCCASRKLHEMICKSVLDEASLSNVVLWRQHYFTEFSYSLGNNHFPTQLFLIWN